jgi:hypothetical protein
MAKQKLQVLSLTCKSCRNYQRTDDRSEICVHRMLFILDVDPACTDHAPGAPWTNWTLTASR